MIFYEGVRAVLIDKDGAPAWNPASIEDVKPEMVNAYFANLGERELSF
jgi:enoyl-CoA hydratase